MFLLFISLVNLVIILMNKKTFNGEHIEKRKDEK